ncbi:hypothetical protein LPJ77_001699 [Coemansia sp. RSA 2523]|nr:hypothetical protein LPJ77_001699 [Coemansia sp. RSA 2523]
MDSRVEQSAFDELPFVFQARIRDIELELDEGEITQKGFDKRYASIMQEYQASVHESRREPIAGNGHKAHTNGMTSVRNPGETGTTVEFEEPTPRVRNGSKKAAYDARKSTVVGFKKPGINFEALLDDLEADSDDPELQPLSKYAGAEASGHSSSASSMSHFPFSLGSPLQPAPPVPDLPRPTRAPYSSSSRTRTDDDDRFDMELSSGRAYNVLSDMMDPYGAQTARSDQQLYSDDSSNNSMLDIDGLGPTEFNPDIITQGAVMRPDELSAGSIDAESATPTIEVKRMNSLMYPRRRHSPPAAATMPHHADLPRQISRQNNSRDVPAESADSQSISVTSDNAIPYDADVAAPAETPQLLIVNAVNPAPEPTASLLTPDTPGTNLFVANTFGSGMAAMEPAQAYGKIPDIEIEAGLTPMSGTLESSNGFNDPQKRFSPLSAAEPANGAVRRSRNGTISFADAAENSELMLEMLSARGNRTSLHVPASEPRVSMSASSNRGSYSHWADYMDEMAAQTQDQMQGHTPSQIQDHAEPMAQMELEAIDDRSLHDGRLAADLEQSLGFSESLSTYTQPQGIENTVESPTYGPLDSVCFGNTISGLTVDPLATSSEQHEPVTESLMAESFMTESFAAISEVKEPSLSDHQSVGQISAHGSPGSPHPRGGARAMRRPTYGPRLDRRPTIQMSAPGVGRASYYAAEAQLEIPVNFDMEMPVSPAMPSATLGNDNAQMREFGNNGAYEQSRGQAVAQTQQEATGSALDFASISAAPASGAMGFSDTYAMTFGDTDPTAFGDVYSAEPGEGYASLGEVDQQTGGYAYEQQGSGAYAQQGAVVQPREVPSEAQSARLQELLATHTTVASVLRHRASATPGAIAYSCVDGKGREAGSWMWSGLHTRAIQTAQLLRQHGVARGACVALVYRKYEMLEFVGSLFGSFYAGVCAVPVVAGDSYAELVHVLGSTGAAVVLTTDLNVKALNKDLAQGTVGPGWPSVPWVRTDALGGTVLSAAGVLSPAPQFNARPVGDVTYNSQLDVHIDTLAADDCAYIEFSKSPNGELKGVQVSHGAIMRQCATWMMSTGMLDVGRKYKHRVELEDDEPESGPDYALGLAEPSQPSEPSTPQSDMEPPLSPASSSIIDIPNEPSPITANAATARGSLGHKWTGSSGFLGRLRNVGSLPKLRRSSRSRDKDGAPRSSTRNSLIGVSFGSSNGRLRATSTLSAVSQPPEPARVPRRESAASRAVASARTPSANVGVFKDVVVYYVEPRQHFGLVYGTFGGCFGGHQTVYASSALCDVPGAYVNLLTRYRATVAVGDYAGLQAVLAAATDDPREIWEFSKKATPNLARLRLCLIDTLFIDPAFHAAFDKNVLHPFGCPYQSIQSTEGHPVVTPVCTLAEHGSVLLAMRDGLGAFAPRGVDAGAVQGCEFVLDRNAFRENRVVVLPGEKNEAEVDEIGTVRYQSFGFPALGAAVAVVDPETRELCASDAIGELWLDSPALGSGFWGLPKLSSSIFAAQFTGGEGTGAGQSFLRTGLMGAVVQGQVLVFGFYEDRIRTLTAEPVRELADEATTAAWFAEPTLGFHYAGDIHGTIRRYLPQVTESAAFEMFSNNTHFPVIAAEVRDNSGKYATVAEEIYAVLRRRHGLYAYAVALCRPDTLPRAFQYGKRVVNAQLCRHQFESGRVDCLFVKITTDHLFMNLPPPAFALAADDVSSQDPSVARYGRWQQQTSLEPGAPSLDAASGTDLGAFGSITEVLAWRAAQTPEHVAYASFDERGRALKPVTFHKLLVRVSAAALLLLEKRRVGPGSHVLIAIAPGPSFVVAVHACLAVGAVPIAVAPPDVTRLADDMPPLLVTAREFGVGVILVDADSEDVFRSKLMDAALRVPSLHALLGGHRMPSVLSLAKATKSPRHAIGRGALRLDPQWTAPGRAALIMLFTGAQPSTPQYVAYSHSAVLAFCAQQKGDFQMPPTLPLIVSVRAYSGYGLLQCCALGLYVGCTTLLLAPAAFFAAPHVWFELVQRHRVKDAFTTLPMLQHAMNVLAAAPPFDLSVVRNFIIATEERIDPLVYQTIRAFFARHRLADAAISPLYGTLMNPCVSTRAYLGVSPLALRLDIHAMRRSKVVALPDTDPAYAPTLDEHAYALTLQDSGKVSGSTMVAIIDPASRQALPAGCIGEVWVCSASNALRKQTAAPSAGARQLLTVGDATGFMHGDNATEFVRTGDLGFLYLQVSNDAAPAEPYLFVAGKVSETFSIDGYMYFYSDIERAVAEPSDDLGVASCVVMQTTLVASPDSPTAPAPEGDKLRLVAVISLRAAPSLLCLPNAACLIFNSVLDRHQVLLDEIVFVPRDSLPRSRISERRRRTVRGLYESGRLNAFVSFPVSNSPTLPSGLANPNNRQSFLGMPAAIPGMIM